MNKYLTLVEEFISSFLDHSKESIDLSDDKINDLRIALLQEELDELKVGIANKDPREVLDALVDLQYVLSGAVLKLGYKYVFDKAFEAVHESNMSKMCNTPEEANATVAKYKADGVEAFIHLNSNGKYMIFRKTDNKILKSINYKKFDADKFI